MADIDGMKNYLMNTIANVCMDIGSDRGQEMTNIISMLEEVHLTAVSTLAGANLIMAKDAIDAGRSPERYLQTVRDLIQTADTSFTLGLRSRVLVFVNQFGTPDPFESASTS